MLNVATIFCNLLNGNLTVDVNISLVLRFCLLTSDTCKLLEDKGSIIWIYFLFFLFFYF